MSDNELSSTPQADDAAGAGVPDFLDGLATGGTANNNLIADYDNPEDKPLASAPPASPVVAAPAASLPSTTNAVSIALPAPRPTVQTIQAQSEIPTTPDLGRYLNLVAHCVRDELLKPLNGVDFHFRRPVASLSPEATSMEVFKLHTEGDANATISQIVAINIRALAEVQGVLNQYGVDLRQRAGYLIHCRGSTQVNAGWLRQAEEVTVTHLAEHEQWVDITAKEVRLSAIAEQRIGIAKEIIGLRERLHAGDIDDIEFSQLRDDRFEAYAGKRESMRNLVRELSDDIGDQSFLERHGNELWDVVAFPR